MNKTPNLLYRFLVVGVIILFISVGIQPAIANVQQEDISKDYVNIKIDVCGLPLIKSDIIQLPREQALEIEDYLDFVNKRFEQVKSREEAKAILNDIVLELDEYGLLGGLSVRQTQRLVTGDFENSSIIKIFENLYDKDQSYNTNNSDHLCLVAGRATYTSSLGLGQTILTAFFGAIASLAFLLYCITPNAPGWFFVFFSILMASSVLIPVSYINPFAIGYFLGFGLRLDYPLVNNIPVEYKTNSQSNFYPSEGFINSYGPEGNIRWSGSFWGQGNYIPSLYNPAWGSSPVGITGFAGIKIILRPGNGDTFFFGSALKVHIGDEFP